MLKDKQKRYTSLSSRQQTQKDDEKAGEKMWKSIISLTGKKYIHLVIKNMINCQCAFESHHTLLRNKDSSFSIIMSAARQQGLDWQLDLLDTYDLDLLVAITVSWIYTQYSSLH
jgi:hypothetical protein